MPPTPPSQGELDGKKERQERGDLSLFVDWHSVFPGTMGPGPDGEAVLMNAPRGVRLAVQPAEISEVVLGSEHPWETGLAYANALKTEAGFKMWYGTHAFVSKEEEALPFDQIKRDDPTAPEEDHRPQITTHLCYAESDDGFTWHKPEVGLFDFAGSRANNIVFPERLEGSVFADPACGFRIFSSITWAVRCIRITIGFWGRLPIPGPWPTATASMSSSRSPMIKSAESPGCRLG